MTTLRDHLLRLQLDATAAKQRVFAAQDEADRVLRALDGNDRGRALPKWLERVRKDLSIARTRLEDLDNAITSELWRMRAEEK